MAMVTDPVCDMQIDPEKTSIQSKFEGRTYFFCSTTCAREFDKHPREVLERHEPPHTTKGLPEAHRGRPD